MTVSPKELLDPAHLHAIEPYALMARTAVEGFLSGMHRSFLHGFGSEFLQYRNYTPGEDLKYLDWKVMARTDRLYSKVFREETNMNCYILLDCSASLDYQGSRAACGKFHYARMVAACIAYLASRQGDNLGFFAYSDRLHEATEPAARTGQLHRMLLQLARLKPGGSANHPAMLDQLAARFRNRGIVIFISDMLEGETILPECLRRLRLRHCDCLAVQVLDPDELDLPQDQVTRYVDAESDNDIISWPEVSRTGYQRRMNQFQQQLREGLWQAQIDYLKLLTSDSLGIALARYLNHRERIA